MGRQRQFISDAAHQLRTPLAIQAHTLEQVLGQSPAQLAQLSVTQRIAVLQRLQRSNQQLINVTNQLLLLAQAEQPTAHQPSETIDLRALCLRCLESFAASAEQKAIDLGWEEQLDPSLAAQGDDAFRIATPTKLLPELINNLVDNALRYTPPHGQVTLGLQAQPGGLVLFVEDNGPGIPTQSHDKVFERFYRLAADTQGTGLGLAIVQEIARSCHARIQLSASHSATADPARPGLRVEVQFPRTQPSA